MQTTNDARPIRQLRLLPCPCGKGRCAVKPPALLVQALSAQADKTMA